MNFCVCLETWALRIDRSKKVDYNVALKLRIKENFIDNPGAVIWYEKTEQA